MKISEPVNVMRERVSLRTSSARSFGYACLILLALVSRDALAQTNPTVVTLVTFQPPETTKVVQAPGTPSFRLQIMLGNNHINYFCDWPTTAQLKNRIETAATEGQLQNILNLMEESTGGGEDPNDVLLGQTIAFWGQEQALLLFSGRFLDVTQHQLAAGPLTLTVKNRCVTEQEARTWINDIRRVIRAYLGLPPPSAGVLTPSTTNRLAPTTPAAIKK